MTATATPQGVSQALADHLATQRPEAISDRDRHEARRALVNIVGCALGGAEHEAVEIAIAARGPFGGAPTARALGRREGFDPLLASLINGISSHVHDFDDTTPSNYIHPTSPVASALFAYASANPVSGADFLHAFILGYEAVTRIGNATYPAHYQAGWHSTGSIGVFGAAAAIGRLMGLTPEQMRHALGLAATQAAGIRDNFGAMAKSLHPGRSAEAGYMAALLAAKGFTAGPTPLEGPRGFAHVTTGTSGTFDLSLVTRDLGRDPLLHENTYKPFPCGIVVHPTIDACLQLVAAHGLTAEMIEAVELDVAPLVLDLCNQKDITVGLQGKFSIYHAAGIALARHRAGREEFSDETVNAADVKAMRARVTPRASDKVPEDGVHVTLRLKDGRVLTKELDASIGNIRRPLSDDQLAQKFRDQAEVLTPPRTEALIGALWSLDSAADMATIIDLATPE